MTVSPPTRQQRGRSAEDHAAALLEAGGLAIVDRNWRCRMGELDLVARDGNDLVFVEVRLRSRADYGGAAGSIDARKQARLIAAAGLYLTRFDPPPPCRFDVILLDGLTPPRAQWLRNAFELP